MTAKRRTLSQTEQIRRSRSAAAQIFGLSAYQNAETVFLYAAVNGEVGTDPIARQALADGKQIAYPVCGKNGRMDFYRVHALSELRPQGFLRIPEPPARPECLVTPSAAHPSIMIVPGVAFDPSRNRLGYGGGYYDRYLSVHRENLSLTVGLAYPFQLIPGLPVSEFDQKPDCLILAE